MGSTMTSWVLTFYTSCQWWDPPWLHRYLLFVFLACDGIHHDFMDTYFYTSCQWWDPSWLHRYLLFVFLTSDGIHHVLMDTYLLYFLPVMGSTMSSWILTFGISCQWWDPPWLHRYLLLYFLPVMGSTMTSWVLTFYTSCQWWDPPWLHGYLVFILLTSDGIHHDFMGTFFLYFLPVIGSTMTSWVLSFYTSWQWWDPPWLHG